MNRSPNDRRPPNRQAPANRRPNPAYNPTNSARPPMSDVERLARERRRRAEAIRAQRAAIITFAAVFIGLLLVAALIILLLSKPSTPKPPDSTTNVTDTTEVTVDGDSRFLFGTLATVCEFTTAGTNDGSTYSFYDENGALNTIQFSYGSDACIVNGHSVTMDSSAKKIGSDCEVPISVVANIMEGVTVRFDSAKNKVVVTREEMTASTKENPKYEPITLRYQTDSPIVGPDEPDDPIIPAVSFRADLSAYEDAMNPIDRDAYLVLVNPQNPVSVDFGPDDLEYVPQRFAVYSGEYQARMRAIAARALDAMLTEAGEYGITDVKATLAYRNYWTQNYLVETYKAEEMEANPSLTEKEAYALVYTYCAPPGTSEHQTGLCVDMHNVWGRSDLELEDFENTKAFEWLRDNCWKFGFIIRYPKGKEDITGYQFECWHFRYVGRYHAYQIFSEGLCLEEYLEQLANQ